MTTDDATIHWPASVTDAPEGWHWGRHVSLTASRHGYYLISDDSAALIVAIHRDDLSADDAPSDREIRAAIRAHQAEERDRRDGLLRPLTEAEERDAYAADMRGDTWRDER